MRFFGNVDRKGYEALDTEDSSEANVPPPPYSAAERDEEASAPSSTDLRKDYQSFDDYQPSPPPPSSSQYPYHQQQQQKRVPDAAVSSSSSPTGPESKVQQPAHSGIFMGAGGPSWGKKPGASSGGHGNDNDLGWGRRQRCGRGRRNGRPCYIRSFCQKLKDPRRRNIILAGFVSGVLFFMFLTRFIFPALWHSGDHCFRDGSAIWDALPEQITFADAVRVNINGGVAGGKIQLKHSTTQEGIVSTRVNVAPNELMKQMQYSLDRVGGETQLSIDLPQHGGSHFFTCVYVDMQIYIPIDAISVSVSTTNMEIVADEELLAESLQLQTSNARIKLDGGWRGEKVKLQTKNAALDIRGSSSSLHAKDSIDLQTSNGAIRLDGADTITGAIRLTSSNGRIATRDTHAASLLDVSTSNARVTLERTTAPTVVARTSNGRVALKHVTADDSLVVQTSNGSIRAQVEGSEHVQATFQSSNGKIRVNMPRQFIGPFKVISSSAKVAVSGNDVTLESDRPYEKIGYRTSKEAEGFVNIHTSNSRAKLIF
ncbi:hypothetical protein BDB00DRAFT_867351 [Zychaea mexicana]|uniref:uncharacterized protein n=1 Tax=Zychaea mexicana TaxID=64656 RepID=UPI0022FDCD2F|nr:uncharacterized protein BDB00DRAFT_867351 [Zychaea mexicana]KAI9498732.1 hypothetical protein BDB00DRAFT_867351 [Zychaea mexicana]